MLNYIEHDVLLILQVYNLENQYDQLIMQKVEKIS